MWSERMSCGHGEQRRAEQIQGMSANAQGISANAWQIPFLVLSKGGSGVGCAWEKNPSESMGNASNSTVRNGEQQSNFHKRLHYHCARPPSALIHDVDTSSVRLSVAHGSSHFLKYTMFWCGLIAKPARIFMMSTISGSVALASNIFTRNMSPSFGATPMFSRVCHSA